MVPLELVVSLTPVVLPVVSLVMPVVMVDTSVVLVVEVVPLTPLVVSLLMPVVVEISVVPVVPEVELSINTTNKFSASAVDCPCMIPKPNKK